MNAPRAHRRIAVKVAVAAAVLVCVPRAAASPSAKLVYIRGSGADACPGEAELRKAVAVRIGYDPFFAVARKTVVAQVERVPRGYHGKVQIVGDDGDVRGERGLSTSGDDCGELIAALALATSIALDDLDEAEPSDAPSAPAEATPSEEAPPAAEPLPESPPRAATPPPARDFPPESTSELAVSLGPTASLGTAPDMAAGASLAAALRWYSFALRADLRGELPASKAIPSGGTVATNVAVATFAACIRGRLPFLCAGPGLGVLFSETRNIARPETDRASILVGSARAGVDIDVSGRLYLEPFAELGASFLPRRVAVDGLRVYETTPVWGTVGIHLGSRLF